MLTNSHHKIREEIGAFVKVIDLDIHADERVVVECKCINGDPIRFCEKCGRYVLDEEFDE